MAGIIASSVSKTMTSGETAADDNESGYVAGEQITLSTFPTGSSYSWGQAIPAGSTALRTALTSTSDASPRFTPDVAGVYVITCTVDNTTAYVIRLSVVGVSPTAYTGAATFPPVTDSSVPTPSTGITVYNSSDQGGWSFKNSTGTVNLYVSTASNGRVIYVGKNGSDSNDGLGPYSPLLTIGAAMTLASSLTPTSSSVVSVVILDGGTYTEDVSVPQYVTLHGPNASVQGVSSGSPAVGVASDVAVLLNTITGVASQTCVEKTTSTGSSYVRANIVTCGAGGICVFAHSSSSGALQFFCRSLFVGASGVGIGDSSSSGGHIHAECEDIYLSGASAIALSRSGPGLIVARVTHIIEEGAGAGSGTAIVVGTGGGAIALNAVYVDVTTFSTIAAAGDAYTVTCFQSGTSGGAGTLHSVTTP